MIRQLSNASKPIRPFRFRPDLFCLFLLLRKGLVEGQVPTSWSIMERFQSPPCSFNVELSFLFLETGYILFQSKVKLLKNLIKEIMDRVIPTNNRVQINSSSMGPTRLTNLLINKVFTNCNT